eukprot:3292837-Rhodomonas_salina.1
MGLCMRLYLIGTGLCSEAVPYMYRLWYEAAPYRHRFVYEAEPFPLFCVHVWHSIRYLSTEVAYSM